MSRIIGIDLGTTFSCAAVIENGRPVIIPNALGSRLTPSVVQITETGDAVVGEHALKRRFQDPAGTITGIKRLIGRRFNEVFDLIRRLPYQVSIDENNLAVVRIRGKSYTPQFISALILRSLKEDAESYLGELVDRAVITVPAYFNEIQRYATKEAGRIAGLEIVRLVNEPTAACMAYGLDRRETTTIAVFDLGGGTFDISLLESGDGVEEVKSTNGDGFLGGDDFDERIVGWMVEEFLATKGLDLSRDAAAMQRVWAASTQAKHELSSQSEAPIHIPFVIVVEGISHNLELTLTHDIFREICDELFQRLKVPCQYALQDAGLGPPEVDHVLLVGGATRIPGVGEIAGLVFMKEPSRSVNPDEAVALGAATQGGVLEGMIKDVLLLDITSASLGVETQGGLSRRIIQRNTSLPTRKSEIFSTIEDNQTSVEVHVLQGEHSLAEGNRTLGRIALAEIPPAAAGVPQIEVTFDLDANAILNVTVKDRETGREVKRTIRPDTGMTEVSLEALERRLPSVRPV